MRGATATRLVVKPKFNQQAGAGFAGELRRNVNAYFEETKLPRQGGSQIVLKTTLLIVVFLGSYCLLLGNLFTSWGLFLCGLVVGLSQVLIVFNIAHDAAHNALFRSQRLNRLFSYSFNLVGASAYLWNITHNKIHHTYPNVGDYDPDIHQQAPFIRVSPAVRWRWYHRFQPYYATLLYAIYSLFLVFQKDYQDFRILPKSDSRLLAVQKHPVKEYFIFFGSKLFYYSYTVVIPLLVLPVSGPQFLAGFLLIHLCMSLLLAAVLIPVHMVDESPFAMVDGNGSIHDSWAVHVFKNTTDYSRKSKLANWLFGGLNTHLVHHLFPGVCHVHYRALSEILQQTAVKYGLAYAEVTMGEAIVSHYRLLKRMAKEP